MNQAFLAIVVKILVPIFTIPSGFADLLWRERNERNARSRVRVAFVVPAFEYESKSMQRISLFSVALLSTLSAGGSALAGPLSLNPPQQNQPPVASIFGAPPAQAAPPVRQSPPTRVAAQPGSGGGFIEFLFGGRGARQGGDYRRYPNFPADLGPGMVESAYHPGQPVMDPRYLRQEVVYDGHEEAGTVVINTRDRMLYLVQDGGRAVRYGIGVGRPGFTWSGVHHVSQKREWPDWTPPDEMLRRRPDLPRHMAGGPDNPLGARALYLGSTLYRIHGSNEPWTIGTQVSSGCIRMRNEDVVDLYNRVKVGTKVVVI